MLSEGDESKMEDELEVETVTSTDMTPDTDSQAVQLLDVISRETEKTSPAPGCSQSEESKLSDLDAPPQSEDSSTDKNNEETREEKSEETDRSDSVIVASDIKEEDSEEVLPIPKTTHASSRTPNSLPSIFSGMHNMCSSSSLLMNMANQSQDSMLLQKQQFMQPSFVQTLLALNNNVVNRQSVLPFMEG